MKREDLRKITGRGYTVFTASEQIREDRYLQTVGFEPDNICQELEMDSVYVDTHQDISFSGKVIHLHTHSFYELICVQNACGMEYNIGGKCFPIQKGDILCIPPNVSHCPLFPASMPTPYVRDVLWISDEFASSMFQELYQHPLVSKQRNLMRTAGTQWEYVTELFHKGVLESVEKKTNWELSVIGNTLALIAEITRILQDPNTVAKAPKVKHPLELAMAYIEEHFAERITLSDVAKYCYISESSVCRIFQQRMGVTFHRCLTQRRLIEAKSLIQEGVGLEEISKAVGFVDYAAFYRAFKREYGISPRQFKSILVNNSKETQYSSISSE